MAERSVVTWEFAVEWGNPYTDPPSGGPRVAARVQVAAPRGAGAPHIPPDIERTWLELNAAYIAQQPSDELPRWPWFIAIYAVDRARRQMSLEGKFRKRRGNLVRRVKRRYPVVAEEMIRAELERRPDYYGLTPEQARSWTLEGESRPVTRASLDSGTSSRCPAGKTARPSQSICVSAYRGSSTFFAIRARNSPRHTSTSSACRRSSASPSSASAPTGKHCATSSSRRADSCPRPARAGARDS